MGKKLIIFFVSVLFCLAGFQLKLFCHQDEDIILGKHERFPSNIMGEDVTYFVKLPGNYDKVSKKYPVTYILNAQMTSTIACAAATIDRLSFELIPEMILVGISNTGRAGNYMPQRPDGTQGGAGEFLRFLTEEFMPFIDKTYRTFDFRILMGQSNTGLFAVYAYLNAPDAVDACIAAIHDPASAFFEAALL